VSKRFPPPLRALLPWIVTACALGYVFGFAIDWRAIPEATGRANLPLFVAITVADKIMFFAVWGVLQAEVIRRFIEPVSTRRLLEVKGGAELLRTVNNSLADAAFVFGVSQLARGRVAAVVAVMTIPFGCHFLVLLFQASLSLALLGGGLGANRDVAILVGCGWALVLSVALCVRLGLWRRLLRVSGLTSWVERVRPRELLPFLGWFCLFGLFDLLIQGSAARAFGVPIDWLALAARIPILYVVMSIPSLGNFGTREIAWAQCFAEFGTRAELISFALWTNLVFLIMHVAIGALFFGRATQLLGELREARKRGQRVPEPLLHDAIDP
jgi:hypothetical protein